MRKPTDGINDRWTEVLRALSRYSCACGSGGGMACDEDCTGDRSDTEAREAIKAVIAALRQLAAR